MMRRYKYCGLVLVILSILLVLTACSDDDPVSLLFTDTLAGLILFYVFAYAIAGVVFGCAANAIVHNKGYDENWFWWGFFFTWIALIVAACKPQVTDEVSMLYRSSLSRNLDRSYVKGTPAAPAGFWKCECGSSNPPNIGTCSCGMRRSEAVRIQAERKKAEMEKKKLAEERVKRMTAKKTENKPEKDNSSKIQDEQAKVKLLKEYKDLFDSGVISEEEFNAKKAAILNGKE